MGSLVLYFLRGDFIVRARLYSKMITKGGTYYISDKNYNVHFFPKILHQFSISAVLWHQPFWPLKDDQNPSRLFQFVVTVINCLPPTLLLSISFMFWWLKDLVSNLNMGCQFLNSLNVLKNSWYLKCFWKKPLFSLVLELFLNSIVFLFCFWQNLVQTDTGIPGKSQGKQFFLFNSLFWY